MGDSQEQQQQQQQSSTANSSSPTPFPHGVFLPNGANTDPPLPPSDPTIGYKLNHFMMRIRDPKRSLYFYINLMGMRTVFTMNVGPFTIYYLGYPQTDEHRADLPKFGLDTATNLQSTLGLLELYHVHGSEKQEDGYYGSGNAPPNLGFGHLGFTVPSVPKAVERLREQGVEILKDLGVATVRSIPISEWENDNGIGLEVQGTETEIHPEYKKVFSKIAFVKDPVSLSLSFLLFLFSCSCASMALSSRSVYDPARLTS
jgi:lactoylglutathione lyase